MGMDRGTNIVGNGDVLRDEYCCMGWIMVSRQGVGMDQQGKCIHVGGLICGVGWIDEVGIRFVDRRDEGMVPWCHGFAAITRCDEGIAAHLALRGSLGGMR